MAARSPITRFRKKQFAFLAVISRSRSDERKFGTKISKEKYIQLQTVLLPKQPSAQY